MGKVADQKIVTTNRTDEAICRRRLAAGGNFSDVIDFVRGKLQQCGPEFLHLEVHVLEVTPGAGFIAELVNRRATVIPDLRREIGEIGKATTTVSECGVSLEPKVSRGRLAIIEMCDRENNIPEFQAMLFARTAHRFEIGPVVWAKRSIIHERIVVITDDARLAGGDESLEILGVVGGPELRVKGSVNSIVKSCFDLDVRLFDANRGNGSDDCVFPSEDDWQS